MAFDRVTREALPQDGVMHLHLFRHGAVDTGGRRRAYGHTDAPLSDAGMRQGASLVDFAASALPTPAGVLSSDLQRCRSIAAPLAERLGVPVRYLPVLREQHMGDWEWQSWEALTLQQEVQVRDYWTQYATARPPGGESLQDLAERLAGWWQAALPELWGQRWLVVGHIGVIRALLCQLFGHPLDQALRFAPGPGTHTHVLVAASGAVLQVLGERTDGGSSSAEVSGVVPGARPTPADRPPRLALSGSAGVGKTTLGRALAEAWGVPYLPEGMRARLEGGLSLHGLSHAALQALVQSLWAEQRDAEQAAMASHGGFVADRSAVDYAAFWLHYHFTEDPATSALFFAETLGWLPTYDRIVLLPWGALPLVADGVRSSNPWIQRHYQATLEGLLAREVDPARLLSLPVALTGLRDRLRWVQQALSPQQGPSARG